MWEDLQADCEGVCLTESNDSYKWLLERNGKFLVN